MDRQISIGLPSEATDLDKVSSILEGRIDAIPSTSSRLVRIFVSSTFSDMVAERNAMMEHVYPKLKNFCRSKYGLEFQIMDLRWGIQEAAHNDHMIIDFCLREIKNSKAVSIGPNFVIFLGQKYGYRPFPPEIAASEFLLIRKALLDDGEDVSLLDQWFVRDENMVPPKYSLWPISRILPDYGNKESRERAEAAQAQWNKTFEQIRDLLRQGVSRCVCSNLLPFKESDKYFISVTEYEIREGMPPGEDCNQTCLTIVRQVDDLEQHLDQPGAVRFIDVIEGRGPPTPERPAMVNREPQKLLRQLRDYKIRRRFTNAEANMKVLHTTWAGHLDQDPNTDEDYIQEFCDTFYDGMVKLVSDSMEDLDTRINDSLVVEVMQHLELCRMRCNIFKGRDRIISSIRQYVTGRSIMPFIIHGVSGSGKTSIIAKAASNMHTWFGHEAMPILVLRFLGTSARSTSIRLVLGSICWQIAEMYGCDVSSIPADYPDLIVHFHELLRCATAEKPLVLMLDSLDQLSASHHAHNLVWLPKVLPNHVKLILSTLPVDHDLCATLGIMYPNSDNFMKVQPLSQSMSMEIIQDWLQKANRQLTPEQMVKVQTALHYNSLPLYTKLVFEEVRQWKSYHEVHTLRLEVTIKGVINCLLDRLEHHHGHSFVKHALSYITASRNGLGDTELEDTMSLDDVILNDVFTYWVPPTRRIPPLLWPRLLDDLRCYIVKREANGVLVNYWYHRQFITVTKDRYLSDPEDRRYIHSLLADYYLGTWAGGRKKPFTYSATNVQNLNLACSESRADRKVPHQPLSWGDSFSPRQRRRVRYNQRKLSELPYHLTMSGRIADLKREILFNYHWLHTKLCAMSLPDILSDFRLTMDEGYGDEEIKVLANSLRMGGSYVNKNPSTLGFDLLGHLLPLFDRMPNLRELLRQCDQRAPEHSALLPIFQCFDSPSEMLLYVLEEHSKSVVDLLFSRSTNELVSLSKDGTIAFWNLDTGEKSRTLDVSELNPGTDAKLLQSNNGSYLVCDSDSETPVFVFEMKTGRLLHKCGRRDQTQKRVFVVQNLLCHKKSIINMRTGRVLNELGDFSRTRQYVTMAITPDEKHLLIGEDHITRMYDLITKKVVASFPGENIPSVFKVSRDSRRVYAGYAVDCLFKVFDIDRLSQSFGQCLMTFNYQKAFSSTTFLTGSPYSLEVAEIDISRCDQNTVLLNIRRCILVVVRVEARHIADTTMLDVQAVGANDNTSLFNARFSPDGQYVVAGEKNLVHIWRLKSGAFLSSLNIHSIGDFPMAVSPRQNLVATASNIHTAIKVWDMDKIHKVSQEDLRIYENPVDMVACAWGSRMLFVKEYFSLSSLRGYKYLDCFGLDVWNLSTGKCIQYLQFGQYGELKQLHVTAEAEQLLLLLALREKTYVTVIDTHSNSITATLEHRNAKWFTASHDGAHIASYSDAPRRQVRLWWLAGKPGGEELVTFNDATQALFTYDNRRLVVLGADSTVSVYCLERKIETPLEEMGLADGIQLLPAHPDVILTTQNLSGDEATVELWNIREEEVEGQLKAVAPGGLVDVSRDGRVGIDGRLQVYDLRRKRKSSTLVNHADRRATSAAAASGSGSGSADHRYTYVKLTHDGKYAVWIESLVIKACRLSDGKIVGNTSLHEEPTSMVALDFGYFFVVGRKDGHVIPMKLVDEDSLQVKEASLCETYAARRDWLLGTCPVSDEMIDSFEPLYRQRPHSVRDNELPKASYRIQLTLASKARIPFAVIGPFNSSSSSREETEVSPSSKRKHRAASEENLARMAAAPRGSLTDLVAAGNRIIRSVALFGSTDNLKQKRPPKEM